MTKWGEKNGIEFWTMPPERAEEGLDVLRNGFFEDEAFCNAMGITSDLEGQKDLEDLVVDCAQDRISTMAVEKGTDRIVGVLYNKFQVAVKPGETSYYQDFMDKKCKSKRGKDLIAKMMWFDDLVDMYDKYQTDSSVELTFLGTHRDFRRRGIAVGLVSAALELLRSLPLQGCPKRPPIATAIFSSPWSIRTGRILQFDELIHVSMEEIVYEGKPFSEHPKVGKDHPGCILMVKRL